MSLTRPDVAPDLTGFPHPRAVELTDVCVDIGRTPVLRDLTLAVATGQRIGLVGSNGAGKSTLLRVIATLLVPVAGTAEVLGADVRDRGARSSIRRRVALLGHEPALHPSLTIRENLELVATLGRCRRSATAVLDVVGLSAAADRRAGDCSRGMVRRAEVARALLTEPDLLLLDEAHGGLDPEAAQLVAALIEDAGRRGGTAIVVSHDLDRLAGLVDRVLTVHDGRVLP